MSAAAQAPEAVLVDHCSTLICLRSGLDMDNGGAAPIIKELLGAKYRAGTVVRLEDPLL